MINPMLTASIGAGWVSQRTRCPVQFRVPPCVKNQTNYGWSLDRVCHLKDVGVHKVHSYISRNICNLFWREASRMRKHLDGVTEYVTTPQTTTTDS